MKTNRAYEYDIDALIPKAVKEARKKTAALKARSEKRTGAVDKVTGKGGFYNHCFFTEHFHRAMKRLAIEAGLRTF